MSDRGISRRRLLGRVGSGAIGMGVALAMLSPGVSRAVAAGGKRLNFVFILIDDLGWKDCGVYGARLYETPNVDKLASQGMRFTDAYAACPVCSPTRASIMTGRYPARLHLTDWIAGHDRPWAKLKRPAFRQELPHEEITIAEALKGKGYVSASIGKWHLGGASYLPTDQGFDLNFAGTQWGAPQSYFHPYKRINYRARLEHEYITDRLTLEAEDFIEANKDRPFFLYLPHFAVHTPLQAKQDKIAKYRAKIAEMGLKLRPDVANRRAIYAAMIESMDESVGRVMAKLAELKIDDRTVVFFMSDNGGLALNGITDNSPLRAGKGTMYEGGVREPMIVRWPGVVKAGSVCNVPVTSTDFFPTILDMAGAKPEAGRALDGVSLVPLLKQTGGIADRALFWHYPHYHPGGAKPSGAIRKGDFKLIERYEDGSVELYDLEKDIGEKDNLAAKMPGKAAELRKELDDWLKSVDAQMPTPNPNYDPDRADDWAGRAKRRPKARAASKK
ncbi:MAG: sulfatase [Phycisphaerae bacterium]|nr:sulfatase [Phycisphaerae bacterium]